MVWLQKCGMEKKARELLEHVKSEKKKAVHAYPVLIEGWRQRVGKKSECIEILLMKICEVQHYNYFLKSLSMVFSLISMPSHEGHWTVSENKQSPSLNFL